MSARTAIGTVKRALNAPSRASPIAGPSRLPLTIVARSIQTEATPAPMEETPVQTEGHSTQTRKRGMHTLTSDLVVRTSKPLKSVLQTYAVLRSVENTYGQVINFSISRDPDSLLPTNILFFTMSEPVNLGNQKTVLHEVQSPKSGFNVLERYGGPSLADIRSILRESHNSPRIGSPKAGSQKAQEAITFSVEPRKTMGYTPPITQKKTTPTTIRQDMKVAEALEKFGDGFFGGFRQLGKKHTAIAVDKQRGRDNAHAYRLRAKESAQGAPGSDAVSQAEESMEGDVLEKSVEGSNS